MPDPVLASGQDVDQEAANELIGGEGHGFVSTGPVNTVILDAKGDAICIGADQSGVRDGALCVYRDR